MANKGFAWDSRTWNPVGDWNPGLGGYTKNLVGLFDTRPFFSLKSMNICSIHGCLMVFMFSCLSRGSYECWYLSQVCIERERARGKERERENCMVWRVILRFVCERRWEFFQRSFSRQISKILKFQQGCDFSGLTYQPCCDLDHRLLKVFVSNNFTTSSRRFKSRIT